MIEKILGIILILGLAGYLIKFLKATIGKGKSDDDADDDGGYYMTGK